MQVEVQVKQPPTYTVPIWHISLSLYPLLLRHVHGGWCPQYANEQMSGATVTYRAIESLA